MSFQAHHKDNCSSSRFHNQHPQRCIGTDLGFEWIIKKASLRSSLNTYYQTDKVMDDLKELTRYQNRLIQSCSKCKTLYVRLLHLI